MRIIQGSRVPRDPTYYHLAYTAATAPIPAPHEALLASGIFLLGSGMLLARQGQPLVFLGRLFSAFFGILAGLGCLFILYMAHATGATGAGAGPLALTFGFCFALGFLSYRWIRAALPARDGGVPANRPDGDVLAGLSGSPLGTTSTQTPEQPIDRMMYAGKALMVMGMGAFAASFLFGKPIYQHPDWMTRSFMREIVERVEKPIKATFTEEQWMMGDINIPNDQLTRKALEEVQRVESLFLFDGWHHPMKIGPTREKRGFFEIVSAGPDGNPGNADDVIGIAAWGKYGGWEIKVISNN